MAKLIKIIMLVSAAVAVLAVAGCASGPAEEEVPAPVAVNAPEFQLEGLDGQVTALSALRGKPVMLNFWATWCGPCREEMPHIQAIYEDPAWREKGLVILAVNVGESAGKAGDYMEENGLSFPVLLDGNQSVARSYNIRGIPTTFFIDESGIIRDVKMGLFTSKADIEWRLINSILPPEDEGS